MPSHEFIDMSAYGDFGRLDSGTEFDRRRSKEIPKATDEERSIMYRKIMGAARINYHELPSIATMEKMNWKELAILFASTKKPSRHREFLSSCGRVNFEQVDNVDCSDTNLNTSFKELYRLGGGIRRQKYFSPHKVTKGNTSISLKEQEEESEMHARSMFPTVHHEIVWRTVNKEVVIPEFERRDNRTSREELEMSEYFKKSCTFGNSTAASGKIKSPLDSTSIKATSAGSKDPTENIDRRTTYRLFNTLSDDATTKSKSLKDTGAHMEFKAFNKKFDVGWIDAEDEIVEGEEWEMIEEKKAVGDYDEYDEWVCLPQVKKT